MDESLGALVKASDRIVALLRAVTDPGVVAVGHWTVGDVACHLAHTFERNVDGVLGRGFPNEDIATIGAYNESYLKLDPERDLKLLAEKLEHQTAEFLAAAREAPDTIPWFGDRPVPSAALPGVLVSESEIHGLDIARATGQPWEIPSRHAAVAVDSSTPMMPWFVDEDAARGIDASFELRIGDLAPIHLAFTDGALEVRTEPQSSVDCRIRADPVVFLLLSYGRVGRWGPMLRGRIFAWGRKPWLALRLQSFLKSP